MPEEQSKPQRWQRHGNTAQWLSALIGLGGVLFLLHRVNTIAWQVDANGAFSRQASARLIYMGYMNAGLQYPQYRLSPAQEWRQDHVRTVQMVRGQFSVRVRRDL